ncbi:MAG: CPBP family intramembrane glutamic endopeptidase [Acidimicrobiia bacterium]
MERFPIGRGEAIGISVGIAAWGNGVVIAGRITGQPEWVTLVGNPAGALAAVLWLRRRGSSWTALGLKGPRFDADPLPRALTATALVWAAGWLIAGLAGGRELSGLRLARLAVGTALAEEVLHRGVLPATWAATGCQARTVVIANMASFGAWHLAGATRGGAFHPLEVVGPALGAVVLLWARTRTGSVLPPAAGHFAGNLTGLGAIASF